MQTSTSWGLQVLNANLNQLAASMGAQPIANPLTEQEKQVLYKALSGSF